MAVSEAPFEILRQNVKVFLENTTVASAEELIKERGVKILDAKLPIVDGVQQLLKWNIRTAPVFDAEKGEAVGVLDLRDCVKFVVTENEHVGNGLQTMATHPQVINRKVSYIARMRKLALLPFETSTFSDLLKPLSGGHHFVAFYENNDQSKLVGFVTQRELFLRIADEIVSHCGDLQMKDFQEYISTPVRQASFDTQAFEAFHEMSKNDVGALAVVNNNGKLVHATSGRDVKVWMAQENIYSLSILDLLTRVRASTNRTKPLSTCTLKTKASKALNDLKENNDERTWIKQSEGVCTGVLTLSDLFRCFSFSDL